MGGREYKKGWKHMTLCLVCNKEFINAFNKPNQKTCSKHCSITLYNNKPEVKQRMEKYLKEYNELIASLTDMSDEDKAEIIPQTVIVNSPIEHFNYSFDKLLALWFTILHDTDSKWEMTVKIFELKETYNYKFKNTYSIDLQEVK